MARIKGRKICWGDGDMMAAGAPEKSTYSGATDKCEGFDKDGSGGRRQTDANTR